MGGRLAAFVIAVATAAGLIAAPAAEATFHLIKVREVYTGTNNDSYVELQMFAAGQVLLSGHKMTVYNSAGALVHSSTFSTGVANSENQRTVLIGDSNVQSSFGVAPDLVDAELNLSGAGGAACWNALGIPADCVAWGNFSGGAALQTATGTSAGAPVSPSGITPGKAIRRTIEPGCPTLLEESDDTDASATDFKEATPAPRDNASAVVETTCAGAPNTAIDDKPALRTNSTAAEFTYEAPTATSYECRLDAATFAACPSAGQDYSGLADGAHTFQVRGVNLSGPDPTPASYSWTVDTVAPVATIDTHPADPGPGNSAAFTFHAGETSTFQCSLVPAGEPAAFSTCATGKTYKNLVNGEYLFEVQATDQAGNGGAPASFEWEVDNSLTDTTPPQTTLDQRPPDPSASSSAFFSYESNEDGSSFECALDGAAFSPCPPGGITYSSLVNGPHAFEVRAIDISENTDPTPAGYSFSVAVQSVPPTSPPPLPVSPPPPQPPAAPQTTLAKAVAKTHDRTPTLRFSSATPGADFECAVDRGSFKPCHSPFTSKQLSFGRHTISVRAIIGGVTDPTPGKYAFKVVRGH